MGVVYRSTAGKRFRFYCTTRAFPHRHDRDITMYIYNNILQTYTRVYIIYIYIVPKCGRAVYNIM